MAGEVSAAQIGEHITMPVAILSDDDDADGWAAASGPDANGLYLGAPPLRNQKFADSPAEGTGFELLVRGRVKLVVGRRRQRN